jgi:acetyl-CoA carboxylase biotin carboxyl carrier protein
MTEARDRRPDPIPPPREPDPPRPASGAATSDEAVAAAPSGAVARSAADAGGDRSLLALIDRLAVILDRSDLQELEIEAGGTALLLRKPVQAPPPAPMEPAAERDATVGSRSASVNAGPAAGEAGGAVTTVKAPLTGLFYTSPSPGAAPYLRVGGELAIGQVIGLIEAMKLFNEIKSDVAGRVVRFMAESGALVKARQPLIEVEPL